MSTNGNFNQDTDQQECEISQSDEEVLYEEQLRQTKNNKSQLSNQNLDNTSINQSSSTKDTSQKKQENQVESNQTEANEETVNSDQDESIKSQQEPFETDEYIALLKKCYKEVYEETLVNNEQVEKTSEKGNIDQGTKVHQMLHAQVEVHQNMKNLLINSENKENKEIHQELINLITKIYQNNSELKPLIELYKEVKKICNSEDIELLIKNFFKTMKYLEKNNFTEFLPERKIRNYQIPDLIAFDHDQKKMLIIDWKYSNKQPKEILINQMILNDNALRYSNYIINANKTFDLFNKQETKLIIVPLRIQNFIIKEYSEQEIKNLLNHVENVTEQALKLKSKEQGN
ncbi:hypothetical protein ABPG74_020866 [Tetrahymena malaccensis]